LTTTNPTSFFIYFTLLYVNVSSNYFVLTKMVYLLYLLQVFLSVSISGMIVVVVLFFFGKRWVITIGGRNQCWVCISNLIYQLVALTLILGPMPLGSSLLAYSPQIREGLGRVILLPYTIKAFPLMTNGNKIKKGP
jgi:intracellular septation protein A